MRPLPHQYIDRKTQSVKTETLVADRIIQTLYAAVRENALFVFNLLISARASSFLGFLNYDCPILTRVFNLPVLFQNLHINPDEVFTDFKNLDTYRKVFERQIRYWKFRPMTDAGTTIVSPADARVLTGSFRTRSNLYIKEKFFTYQELIGTDKRQWIDAFKQGDFAVFRLTPEKYHYNHTPVSGRILDTYEINGLYHSCNPGAVVRAITPYSKNRRMVTIIDTDVENGTRAGLVAMVEVVALMIGRISQCYSPRKYDSPKSLCKNDFIEKGQPKSLFKPGSSTTILIFQKGRIQFSPDLLENRDRPDIQSRFTMEFETPLVETELNVRETIGEVV